MGAKRKRLAEERTRCAGTVTSQLRCRGARSSKSVTAEGQRLRRGGRQTAKRRSPPDGGLESCFIQIPQSYMTSEEQRRSRLGEATPHSGVPLILRRLLNPRSQPLAQPCVQHVGMTSILKQENSHNSKSVPCSHRLCEPQVANLSALPSFLRVSSFLRVWVPSHRNACALPPA
jgi:hypothetical protein